MCGDSPLRLAAPDRDRPVGALDLLLDRVRERRQVAVALFEQQRTVLHSDEPRIGAFDVRRFRRHHGVVLPFPRESVNPSLADHPGEERARGRLDEAALLGKPLVQRLAPEQSHYPDGSIRP